MTKFGSGFTACLEEGYVIFTNITEGSANMMKGIVDVMVFSQSFAYLR